MLINQFNNITMKYALFSVIIASLFFSGCALYIGQIPSNTGPADTSGNNTPATTEVKPVKNSLNLSNQQLNKAPEYIFSRTNLEELNLSNNQLTGSIQAEIRFLQNLRVLNASNNLMTGVPAEVGQLKNLEILDLSNNQLTGLPYELGNLKNLKTLDISGNNYSTHDLDIITKTLPADVQIIK